MYTSVAVATLVGFLIPTPPSQLPWRGDYAQARSLSKQLQRPVAVIVGAGKTGFEKLSASGKLTPATRKLLSQKYVAVFVDSSTPAGRRLASQFEISRGTGIVLSDRTGELQAFHHSGSLADTALEQYLRSFAQPAAKTTRTATVSESPAYSRTSYYQAPAALTNSTITPTNYRSVYSQPNYQTYSGGFGGFGGFGGGGGC